MSIVRYTSPLDVDSAFNDMVRRSLGTPAGWTPAADIYVDGPDAVITVELPGVAAGDVSVDIKDRTLTVSGTRDNTPSGEEGRVLRREIRRGAFARTFRLPAHVTTDAVTASYDAGMLTIRVAGAQPAPVSQRVVIENLAEPEPTEAP